MFSGRLPPSLAPNAPSLLRAALGAVPFDLTVSNPTACGIDYPEDLLAPLADPRGLDYRPDPRGLEGARQSVSDQYASRGVPIDPDRIVLTASSSESYSFLFKVLCDPGDAVRVPLPSYPLFEYLAALEGVRVLPYRLDPHVDWQPHLDEVPSRAVIVVHPNNPTGSLVLDSGLSTLDRYRRLHGAPLISDEVFLDFPLDPSSRPESLLSRAGGLVFALGGLSKSVGLPQLKLSWIAVEGPAGEAERALERLEFVADTYLSVATPVQVALPRLLEAGSRVRAAILERCRANLAALTAVCGEHGGVTLLAPEAGWSAVVRLPSIVAEETLVLDLLREDGVAVQPGYFYDFEGSGYVVVSLLPPPEVFLEGVRRLLRRASSLAPRP